MSEGERARAWVRGRLRAVCDTLERWESGTVALASRYPDYYDFNHVRVERPVPADEAPLIAFADTVLATRAHRRIDFEHAAHGEPLRPAFTARGWSVTRLVRMRLAGSGRAVPGGVAEVEAVPQRAVRELRAAWLAEDFPGVEVGDHLDDVEAVAAARGAQMLATRRPDGTACGFAELELAGDGAEVVSVYVAAAERGRGLGTALTAAAIGHAGGVRDLWITADADDRPQRLYARLGFEPVAHDIQFLRAGV